MARPCCSANDILYPRLRTRPDLRPAGDAIGEIPFFLEATTTVEHDMEEGERLLAQAEGDSK